MVGLRNVAHMRGKGGPRLGCLAGQPAPQALRDDAACLERLPPKALPHLWDVLEPCLTHTLSAELERTLTQFCSTHEVDEEALGRLIRALGTMLRGAASIGLPKEAFAADLDQMWPHQTEAHETFLARYDALQAHLRNELLTESLVRHGNALVDIDWRIDQIMGNAAAPRIALPVAIVTFAYQRNDVRDHFTLQLTPRELKRAAAVFSALAEQAERLLASPPGGAAPSSTEQSETP